MPGTAGTRELMGWLREVRSRRDEPVSSADRSRGRPRRPVAWWCGGRLCPDRPPRYWAMKRSAASNTAIWFSGFTNPCPSPSTTTHRRRPGPRPCRDRGVEFVGVERPEVASVEQQGHLPRADRGGGESQNRGSGEGGEVDRLRPRGVEVGTVQVPPLLPSVILEVEQPTRIVGPLEALYAAGLVGGDGPGLGSGFEVPDPDVEPGPPGREERHPGAVRRDRRAGAAESRRGPRWCGAWGVPCFPVLASAASPLIRCTPIQAVGPFAGECRRVNSSA